MFRGTKQGLQLHSISYTLISLFQVQSKEAETFQIFRASSTWLFTEAYLGPVN